MDIYEDYKPFRNFMRQFDLLSSLEDVWRYSLHVIEDQPLPTGFLVGKPSFVTVKRSIYPWDMDILSKELVLNAGTQAKHSLRNWNDLAKAVNHIRRLEDKGYTLPGTDRDVMLELHRIAHRQFHWRTHKGMGYLVRAFKVFGEAAVEAIVVRELGMTMQQFITLGVAVTGHFFKNWGMSTEQDYTMLGISRDASTAFFQRLICPLQQLKAEVSERQSYDEDWFYTWNPLEAKPLISFDPSFPERIICPIPHYLPRRASVGVFYDLINSAGFDNPFGNSFQAYIGEVIEITCQPPRFLAVAEDPYYVGTEKMHGVDWILSDNTGHLFIECKTKRLTVNAKVLSDKRALEKDLSVMAEAIVQHYLNINRALRGQTHWTPNALPVYPVVLTLEDWHLFSPGVHEILKSQVCHLLAERGLTEDVLEEIPYTIASAQEFEVASQIIAQTGIYSVMAKKTAPEQRMWNVIPFLVDHFKEEMRNVNWRLFPRDWDRLMDCVAAMPE